MQPDDEVIERPEKSCDQISFTTAEFENARTMGKCAVKKMPVSLAKEDLKELRIMPDLGIFRV
jgi:hypothetical protein